MNLNISKIIRFFQSIKSILFINLSIKLKKIFNNDLKIIFFYFPVKAYQENILERGFKGWTMAFKSIDEVDTSGIDGFSEFSKLGFTNERTKVSPSIAINLLQSFKNSLP